MDIQIGSRWIGKDHPTYFVADIAANHDGSLERAKYLIKLAKQAGADAAKFQNFSAPNHFWGRPSATAPMAYNGAGSGGSNQGPLNPALADAVKARIAALRVADPDNTAPVPVDLVTASGSGLDPHLSPAAAEYQVARVARARGLDPEDVRALVAQHRSEPQFGLFGDARVNVLTLNLALDALRP